MATKKNFSTAFLFGVLVVSWGLSCSRAPSTQEPPPVSAIEKDGLQEVKIRVKGEYTPDRILVKKGIPLRLVFYRDNASACTEYVVLEDFAIRQKLAPYQETVVALTPARTGEFTFTCGMKMLEGKLIVTE
jgi:plastocyanin domain-containing protein